jgi:CspA family cold shock protein
LTGAAARAHFWLAIRALGLQTIAPAKIASIDLRRKRRPLPPGQELSGPRFWEGAAPSRNGFVKESRGDMANGTVKWFNSAKGYGFIQPEDGGKDVFVHISAVERAGLRGLNEGQKVAYELQAERGRTAAVNLRAL